MASLRTFGKSIRTENQKNETDEKVFTFNIFRDNYLHKAFFEILRKKGLSEKISGDVQDELDINTENTLLSVKIVYVGDDNRKVYKLFYKDICLAESYYSKAYKDDITILKWRDDFESLFPDSLLCSTSNEFLKTNTSEKLADLQPSLSIQNR